MHRPVQRLTRTLVCAAAVPVMLIVSGCSSDSDSGSGSGDDAKQGSSASASTDSAGGGNSPAAVQQAAYAKLPDSCAVLSKKTLKELVPEAKGKGKAGQSDDIDARSSCSWSSLKNNGVKGSQFRWLNVSLLRFDSSQVRGSGEKLATEYFAKQVEDAQSAPDAKSSKSAPVSGIGNEATAIRYDLKKKEGTFKQQTVVARVENVVVTLDYNGAGLAGDKAPNADDLAKLAQNAVKESVAAVSSANGAGGGGQGAEASPGKSGSPSKGASPNKSASPSKSAAGQGASPAKDAEGASASPSKR
ncbi:DUF3558 domain-containing protein [Streptomyces cavernae]|uniref:DUF3558 domain-containing protein n=1 Tax=Streptomyces cavernae TaxID=2259034 RepID=UPI000FEB833D|nr:DUF3558 domain-containing protein [Streptomyces cavernae]